MERCPVCRARLKERQICRRCDTDLGLAIAAENKADHYFQQALVCLKRADIKAAKIAIHSAILLHNKAIYQHFSGFIESQIAE